MTQAVLDSGVPCIRPFDIQLNKDFNILDNLCYELMLRIVAARLVANLHGAPPCTEYSLLKLKRPGPPPCRSPDCMNSPMFDNPGCHERFFSSREIMLRTIHLLRLNHVHGGYSSLESPLSAMTWDEDFVKLACIEFLVETAIFSHCQTCEPGEEPWNKDWKFVSNIPGFSESSLQCQCLYRHPSFAGKRDHDGKFISSNTAQYPLRLVDRINKFFNLKIMSSTTKSFQDMRSLLDTLPERAPLRLTHIPDGGGLASSALWPLPFTSDVFLLLRKKLEKLCYRPNCIRWLHHIFIPRSMTHLSLQIYRTKSILSSRNSSSHMASIHPLIFLQINLFGCMHFMHWQNLPETQTLSY